MESPLAAVSPLDFAPLAAIDATPAADVKAMVARAAKAQPAWSEMPLERRIAAIFKVRDRILDRGDEVARTLHLETGKPEAEAWSAEVVSNADLVEHWCANIERLLEPEEVVLDAMSYPGKGGAIERVPRGVVGLITPWNFPVAIPLRALIPALLAGNAVIFKPSEFTPRCGAIVASLFEGLLPDGVLQVAQGGGDVGAAVVSGGVDLIVFTGSVATGRKIAVKAAEQLVPCSLELGGKDAALVLEDADVERAARGLLWGAFTNAGQNCASVERVYVHEKLAKPLTEKLVELTKSLRTPDDVGPLTTKAQLEIVKRHVAGAKERGAKVLCGGEETGQGLGFQPTVLEVSADAEREMALMTDETFGPVLPIVVVKSEAEAIERANGTRYGLTASVWCGSLARGEKVARKLRAGVVTINNHGFTGAVPAAPWSGVGESGHGVTNSSHALSELTRPKFVLVDRARGKMEMWWMPYTPAFLAVLKALSILRSGSRGIGEKIRAIFALLSNAPKRMRGG
jgi:acyl-CoA reductase-like NAD-dependent aldehyde dehydrogenase